MKIWIIAALTVLVGLTAPQARAANEQTGNDILESCRKMGNLTPPKAINEALYIGDCAGMSRTLVSIGSHLQPSMRFCMPGAATFQQAAKVFVAYMDANPQRLHELSLILAIDAFRAAWPCKK